MTDLMLAKSEDIPMPKRPDFEISRTVEWVIYPAIHATLGPTRRADGSFPDWVMRLANQITVLRGVLMPLLAPFFAWAALTHQMTWLWCAFVGIATLFLMDGVDGAVARYTGSQSGFGATWDPIMDKLSGASLMFWWLILIAHYDHEMYTMSLWLVLVRVALDVGLFIIALLEHWRGAHPKAGRWGKIKATFDDFAMLAGYAGVITFAYGASGHGLTLSADLLLGGACLLAPMSIAEHVWSLVQHWSD